jgi:hypothetical protein
MTIEEKVRANAYDNPLPYSREPKVREAYDKKDGELYDEFVTDLRAYLLAEGVPEQYVGKVISKAWEDGHSSGYSEVFNCALGLAEIFS